VDKVLHLGWSPIYLRLETTTYKGGLVCKALACAGGSLAGSFMRAAPVLRFSWVILGGSLAHHLARRALARTLGDSDSVVSMLAGPAAIGAACASAGACSMRTKNRLIIFCYIYNI
jgi:hypothetical protein